MKVQDLRSMLDRMPGIRHAGDVDLLVFFYRHPRALLTGEQLIAYAAPAARHRRRAPITKVA
jgi:hypothetical protein